jgi:hypothetical protein
LDEKGTSLRWGGSFALVDEETHICIIGAASVEDVVHLSERARLEHDHVVEVLVIDASPTQGR